MYILEERERERERERESEWVSEREKERERDGTRILDVEVNSHHMTLIEVTPLLDNYEFLANMWLPNCTVNLVATNSCFDKCRRHCVLAELNVEHMLASSPWPITGDEETCKVFGTQTDPAAEYMRFSLLFPMRKDRNSFFALNVYKKYGTLFPTIKSLRITMFIIVHTITVRMQYRAVRNYL